MGEDAGREKPLAIEAEFAHLVKYVDLYLRQKTDLYIQHYLFEPFEFLVRQLVYLSVLAALLVAGTLAIIIGVILYVSTLVPLWEFAADRRHRGPGHLRRRRLRAVLEPPGPEDPDHRGADETWERIDV